MNKDIHNNTINDYALILSDTFESYDEGPFSEEATAIRETHFTEKKVDQGPWTVISTYHTDHKPGINVRWIIEKRGSRKVLKQTGTHKECIVNWKYFIKRYILNENISPMLFFPSLVVGDENWRNYRVDTQFQPLSKTDFCGILFRLPNSMQHYLFALKKNKAYLLKRDLNSLKKLAVSKHDYECNESIHISIETIDDLMECYINDIKIFSINDSSLKFGKCGILSNIPAIFESFTVRMGTFEKGKYLLRKEKVIQSDAELKMKTPGMQLIKKMELPVKCTGRSIRFGGLSGKGQLEYLIIQGIHPKSDSDKTIFMAAIDGRGRIIWQKGDQSKDKTTFPADVPVQIYDIDNDGNNEVICEFGDSLQILDGRTGKVKHQTKSPRILTDTNPVLSVLDSIFICNLTGKSRPENFLIKDMYSNIYAYNNNLNMLWSYQCNTGHYPFTFDLNGDGRENVLVGYTLLDPNGKKIWELDLRDHADAVAIFKSNKKNENIVTIAASNEGFIIADTSGQIKKHLRIGHMQTITIAKIMPGSNDYQIATNTYWGNPGVIYILDLDGNILNIFQPSVYGSQISPVKWTKDTEFILLSASIGKEGGMYNGLGQQVVSFPDDGHPNLCCHVCDIDNDGLDEIICWDQKRLWIYRTEESGEFKIDKPIRYPSPCNQSNYRSSISI